MPGGTRTRASVLVSTQAPSQATKTVPNQARKTVRPGQVDTGVACPVCGDIIFRPVTCLDPSYICRYKCTTCKKHFHGGRCGAILEEEDEGMTCKNCLNPNPKQQPNKASLPRSIHASFSPGATCDDGMSVLTGQSDHRRAPELSVRPAEKSPASSPAISTFSTIFPSLASNGSRVTKASEGSSHGYTTPADTGGLSQDGDTKHLLEPVEKKHSSPQSSHDSTLVGLRIKTLDNTGLSQDGDTKHLLEPVVKKLSTLVGLRINSVLLKVLVKRGSQTTMNHLISWQHHYHDPQQSNNDGIQVELPSY